MHWNHASFALTRVYDSIDNLQRYYLSWDADGMTYRFFFCIASSNRVYPLNMYTFSLCRALFWSGHQFLVDSYDMIVYYIRSKFIDGNLMRRCP